MHLLFLGTGAADWPDPGVSVKNGRRFASLLLEQHILVDCGPMTLGAVEEFRVDVNQLTDIIIGHPHGDHFDFRTVCELARRRQRQLPPLRLHINAVAMSRATPPPELHGRLVTMPYSPGETLICPDLTVQALAANHNCDYGEKAAYLLFTNAAGETLFYALDGAWLPTSTWGFLRRRPEPLTAIIWDLTCGDSDDWRVCEHCNLAMVKAMTRVLRAHSKAIGPETTLFCSHLARALCPEHSFFAPQLASQGYVLAYDGMAITVSRP
ncbi:MAG TPA: MBL fold metallo-hydrolase [Lentisphaeria bacterium]|nr:MAG: ribonuclease Z [Lentisphaerae bacterium ADurb.Bin082]HPY90765.1 MBL fold metallo-hydrolase [Lentisphaeria bacterium]HQL88758.1 MBL fold metallo-hydrolase [Lentisphaeria bacterium]